MRTRSKRNALQELDENVFEPKVTDIDSDPDHFKPAVVNPATRKKRLTSTVARAPLLSVVEEEISMMEENLEVTRRPQRAAKSKAAENVLKKASKQKKDSDVSVTVAKEEKSISNGVKSSKKSSKSKISESENEDIGVSDMDESDSSDNYVPIKKARKSTTNQKQNPDKDIAGNPRKVGKSATETDLKSIKRQSSRQSKKPATSSRYFDPSEEENSDSDFEEPVKKSKKRGKTTQKSNVPKSQEPTFSKSNAEGKAKKEPKAKKPKASTGKKNQDSDSDDWEEVDIQANREDGPSLGKDVAEKGVTVVIEKDKDESFKNWVAQQLRKIRKQRQLNVHKTFLICFVGAGIYRSSLCNNPCVKALALSIIQDTFLKKKLKDWNVESLKGFTLWFHNSFKIERKKFIDDVVDLQTLEDAFNSGVCKDYGSFVLVFVACLRALGFQCRIVWSCQPPIVKSKAELSEAELELMEKFAAARKEESMKPSPPPVETKPEPKARLDSKIETLDDSDGDFEDVATKTVNVADIKALLMQTENLADLDTPVDTQTSSKYFKSGVVDEKLKEEKVKEPEKKEKKKTNVGSSSKAKEKEASDSSKKEMPSKVDIWAEVYLPKEGQWCSVSCIDKIVHKPYVLEKHATEPLSYVFGFDSNNYVKDVTKRYCLRWGSVNQKLRVEWIGKADGKEWFEEFMGAIRNPDLNADKKEDIQINDQMSNMPIPSSIAELKDHPLYVLERHLLKFEVLHPKNAPILGQIKEEPVFSRQNVKLCHTEQNWLKEGMGIKKGEYPVKYVKPLVTARKMRKAEAEGKDIPMVGIYGDWQVELYRAPPVVDGRIPRNAYNNVELFKMHMLPPGSAFLDLPGLDKIAKSLDIDCAPAMRGWDFSGCHARPVIEGFVVPIENETLLRESWQVKKEEAEAKAKEVRAMANWKRLVKAFKISQVIKRKYEYSDAVLDPNSADVEVL